MDRPLKEQLCQISTLWGILLQSVSQIPTHLSGSGPQGWRSQCFLSHSSWHWNTLSEYTSLWPLSHNQCLGAHGMSCRSYRSSIRSGLCREAVTARKEGAVRWVPERVAPSANNQHTVLRSCEPPSPYCSPQCRPQLCAQSSTVSDRPECHSLGTLTGTGPAGGSGAFLVT